MNSFHCSYKKTCCFPCSRNLFLQCSEDSCPVRWSKVSGAKLVKGTFCRPSWSMVYMATTGERKSVYHSTSPIMVWKIHTVLTCLFYWECINHKLHSIQPCGLWVYRIHLRKLLTNSIQNNLISIIHLHSVNKCPDCLGLSKSIIITAYCYTSQ